jgi:ubiquinone/menaquinone biosynthesis C-methylase UbiE
MQPRSNIEWRKWAKDDPLYGIATCTNRSRDGANPWTLPEFFEYGAINWAEYYAHWRQYGLDQDSCLEIGCGAGRISHSLIQCFAAVYAVDISPDMLELAKSNVTGPTFLLSDGHTLPMPDSSVSAVFSCQVFQHFDTREIALAYFREIYRTLRSGGSCLIHLPIAVLPLRRVMPAMAAVHSRLWRATEEWVRLKANAKRWQIAHGSKRKPFYRMIQYEPEWLVANLSKMGFRDIEIDLFQITGDPGQKVLESHLLAKK